MSDETYRQQLGITRFSDELLREWMERLRPARTNISERAINATFHEVSPCDKKYYKVCCERMLEIGYGKWLTKDQSDIAYNAFPHSG